MCWWLFCCCGSDQNTSDNLSRYSEGSSLEMPRTNHIHFEIANLSTGNSYESLFEKYFTNKVTSIKIDEPHLTRGYQLHNLLRFLELAVKSCVHLRNIIVRTKDEDRTTEQTLAFENLKNDLHKRNIKIDYIFIRDLHDRGIVLNTGVRINIGRGLDYFLAPNGRYTIGYANFDLRRCKLTKVDIYLT